MRLLSVICLLLSFKLQAIEVGKKIDSMTLPVWKSDETFKLDEALKKKKVVINFWASWCTACINELAELEELKAKNSDKYEFIAVNAGERKVKIKKFFKKHKFTYKILVDKNKAFSKSLGVEELPRTLVLDNNGVITFSGTRPPKELK